MSSTVPHDDVIKVSILSSRFLTEVSFVVGKVLQCFLC